MSDKGNDIGETNMAEDRPGRYGDRPDIRFRGGKAASANRMPLVSLEPSPDFQLIARASRAHAERVEDADDLPAALERALRVIREERRSALLDVRVAQSDRH